MIHPITAEQMQQKYAAYEKYAKCCEMGLSRAETSRALGVSKAAVCHAANRYHLTFNRARDGALRVLRTNQQQHRAAQVAELAAAENAALRRASQ